MKKIIYSTVFIFFVSLYSNATVWRVNNNTTADADFTQLSTAFASASVMNGDTLYVEPSSSLYNNASLNKQLVIIGNGFRLDTAGSANGNPGLQENVNFSQMSWIRFQSGSTNSVVIGMTLTTIYFDDATNDITIERCNIGSGSIRFWSGGGSVQNISVRKCLFGWGGGQGIFNSSNITVTNLTIENCIFYGIPQINPNLASTNIIFRNNTADYFQGTGVYVANNIFITNSLSTFNSCIIRNNIFVRNQPATPSLAIGPLSTNGNNLVGQTLTSLIVNTGSDDGRFQLAAGSPAIGGGVDIGGVKPDCGAFGGPDPYVLSGIPNIPTIYSLEFPNGNSVPSGTSTILIDFSTRGNN